MTLAPGKWRRQYDEPVDQQFGDKAATINLEDSLTVQSFKDDTDINVLMDRMGVKDGSLLPIAPDPRYFGDFTVEVDLRQALEQVRIAQQRFMLLPARVRSMFSNNPAELLEFVEDPANREEAVKLGLLAPPPSPPPADTQPVSAST